jgi:hypothetical protein
VATGGGFGGRQLYTDHHESVFDATRPLVFNAIPDLGSTRPDFLDRARIVELLRMPPEMRCDEARFWCEISERRPRALGALLDAAVAGLRNLPDFALWVSACEEALEMEPGEAQLACNVNFTEARSLALDAFPLSGALRSLAKTGFRGTMVDLLAQLNRLVCDDAPRSPSWPKTPSSLGTCCDGW